MMAHSQRQFAGGRWKLAVCNSVDTSASVPGNSPRDLLVASGDVTVLSLASSSAQH